MGTNFLAILVAAFASLVIGAIWYHPKVFGTAWMKAAEMSEEKIKGANMVKLFAMVFLLALFLAFALQFLTIHQTGAFGMIGGDVDKALPSYQAFINDYGMAYRTFKHGALHGFMSGIFIALPIIGINALFERKSAKYIFINSGYWTFSLMVMGGIICAWP